MDKNIRRTKFGWFWTHSTVHGAVFNVYHVGMHYHKAPNCKLSLSANFPSNLHAITIKILPKIPLEMSKVILKIMCTPVY